MRLFLAIELPDHVKKMLGALRTDMPAARWLPPEQLHITLAFLGDLADDTAELLTKALAEIRAQGFEIRFSVPGCFPNRNRPRVLWVGLEPEPRLDDLAARVRDAVLASGIPQEERPFSPHITLARLKVPAPRETALFLQQTIPENLPPVAVGEFILFQSRLTPQGAIHTPLKSFHLS